MYIVLVISREIHLKERPVGMPKNENFELAEVQIPESRDGEYLVRNIWISVDPYMRGRMTARKSYVPPFELGGGRQYLKVLRTLQKPS